MVDCLLVSSLERVLANLESGVQYGIPGIVQIGSVLVVFSCVSRSFQASNNVNDIIG